MIGNTLLLTRLKRLNFWDIFNWVPENWKQFLAPETSRIPRNRDQKIWKQHWFHPYEMLSVQKCIEDSPDRRIQFSKDATEWILNNLNFLCSTFFFLVVNRHNCRYWRDFNVALTILRMYVPGFWEVILLDPFFHFAGTKISLFIEVIGSQFDHLIV